MSNRETWGDGVEFYSMIYDEGKDLEPPIVLAEFAQFYLTVIKDIRDILSKYPVDAPLDFDIVEAEIDFDSLTARLKAIEEGLPTEAGDAVSQCF